MDQNKKFRETIKCSWCSTIVLKIETHRGTPLVDGMVCGKCQLEVVELRLEQAKCEHINTAYQPEERDTNVPESFSCDDCAADLPLPTNGWE